MRTLAIETSCDDTSLSIVNNDQGVYTVEYLRAFTQLDIHRQYGGVVPELASRSHAEKIVDLIADVKQHYDLAAIDCISVTAYPGLPGALLVWKATAHTLWEWLQKPVIEVNHIMGHVFSILCGRSHEILKTPYVCLTVSGGHNDLYVVTDDQSSEIQIQTWQQETAGLHKKFMHLGMGESAQVWPYTVTKIGQTMDDTAGEVGDKVARMLGGPVPGGKWLREFAEKGTPNEDLISIRSAHAVLPPFCFSFSGIKSQVANYVDKYRQQRKDTTQDNQDNQNNSEAAIGIPDHLKSDIAYKLFQEIDESLTKQLIGAGRKYAAATIGLCGGVSANPKLRERIQQRRDVELPDAAYWSPAEFVYCTDNAAMIGVAGLIMYTY